MHFDNLGYLNGQQVSSAVLWLYNWYSFSCTPSTTNIYQVNQAWSGSGLRTYPGAGLGGLAGSASLADGCPGCANGPNWVGFNVTSTVANWAATNGATNLGLAAVSPNETDSLGWKKFYSWNQGNGGAGQPTPHIDITWSSPATAPSAPTNAQAVPANNSANLTWGLSAPNGGAAIDSYYVNTFDGVNNSLVRSVGYCATCTSANVASLTNGHPYYFGVYAHNAVNFSQPSVTSVITPTPPPGRPQGAVATPGNGASTMVWAPPVPNGGSAITQYAVLVYDTANNYTGHLAVVCATCYSATVTGLTNGVAYNLFVTAGNPAGYGLSTKSGPITPNINVPGAPTGQQAYAPGSGSIGVTWTPAASGGTAPITSYAVNTYDLASGYLGTSAIISCPAARRCSPPSPV